MRIDQSDRCALADAGHAEYQIEPAGEIVMVAQRRDDAQRARRPPRLQARDVGHDDAAQPRVIDMLEPGLQTRDVLLDLLDEGQMVGKRGQPRIRLDAWPIDRGRAGCDQHRIERVVLGAAQMQTRIGTHLDRLQHQDHEAAARKCLTTPRS